MASPNHMKGINALPRLSKAEWQAQQINAASSRLYAGRTWDPNNKQWLGPNGKPIAKPAPAPSPFGKQGTLSKQLTKQLQKEVNQAVADKMPKHATLESEVPSTCLASLTWKDGMATAEFYRGGQIVYDFPMTKEEFIDWVSSDSIGQYGNAYVFE